MSVLRRSLIVSLGTIALAFLFGARSASAAGAIRAQGRHFKDAQGATVILRGVNVGGDSKVPPFRPINDPSELDPLAAWGMNVIRLLFNWEAYEPAPGEYNEDYLAYLTSIADAAWARGLYTIVDFHQDGFSRFVASGCGEGFPVWAVSPSVTPVEPDNGPNCAAWGIIVPLSPDMHQSFGDFYADTNGVRTRYLYLMWKLADHFKSHPGVIGYDLINEPWGYEQQELSPLYEDAAVVVRSADPKAMIFVSPAAITSAGFQTTLNKPTFDNFAYSPHFYDVTVTMTKLYSGITIPTDLGFGSMAGKASEWNVPLFVGEFGAPGEGVNLLAYVDLLYARLNDNLASGAQWVYTPNWTDEAKDGWNMEDFSIVDDEGNIRQNFKSRPYARRIAGTPTQLTVTDWGLFSKPSIELKWSHTPGIGQTELFIPRSEFFGNEQLVIEREGVSCGWSGTNKFTCSSGSAGAKRVKVRTCNWFLWWCL